MSWRATAPSPCPTSPRRSRRNPGADVVYKDLPVADYAKVLEGAGLAPGLAAAIAGWDAEVAKGALESDDTTLSRLIGRPTTPLAEVVKAALAG